METISEVKTVPSEPSSFSFDWKNGVIVCLIVLLVLAFLGINLLNIGGHFLNWFSRIFVYLFVDILAYFGYAAGSVINVGADVVGDVAKVGIGIAEGTAHDVGDLLKKPSMEVINHNSRNDIDRALNYNNKPMHEPSPMHSENPIQKPISSSKIQWCLVGEYEEKRGCIEIGEHEKCMSGQVFPTQQMCLARGPPDLFQQP
jgi:hypothetical protein